MFNCLLFESVVAVVAILVYSSVLIVLFNSLFLCVVNSNLKVWMNMIVAAYKNEITENIFVENHSYNMFKMRFCRNSMQQVNLSALLAIKKVKDQQASKPEDTGFQKYF
jgi:hypothetical protein